MKPERLKVLNRTSAHARCEVTRRAGELPRVRDVDQPKASGRAACGRWKKAARCGLRYTRSRLTRRASPRLNRLNMPSDKGVRIFLSLD